MTNIIEKVNGNKKVLISRSHTCNKGKYSYYLTYLCYQPYLSMGWVIYPGERQLKDINSLKDAKKTASNYLCPSKLSTIE